MNLAPSGRVLCESKLIDAAEQHYIFCMHGVKMTDMVPSAFELAFAN